MIHTKSLIRRLAYVPWLLAFGLVLGWAGEAQAQRDISVVLTVPDTDIREGTSKDVKITATLRAGTGADAADTTLANNDVDVLLTFTANPAEAQPFFRISSAIVTIPKTKAAGEKVITISALQSPARDAANSDFTINVDGTHSGAAGVNTADIAAVDGNITIVDDDKPTTTIDLSFDPASLPRDAGKTPVKVTATLNGETIKHSLSFQVVGVNLDATSLSPVNTALGLTGDDVFTLVEGTEGNGNRQGGRDTDYNLDPPGMLTIPKRKATGTLTIMVDPAKPSWFALGASAGTDLRYDADEDATTHGTDSDGNALTAGGREAAIAVQTNIFSITATTEAAVKSDGFTADKTSIREDGGPQEIELTVTLQAALKEDATVNLSIVDLTVAGAAEDADGGAERDVTYFVSGLSSVTIPGGETSGKTSFTLTPVDNESSNDPRIIRVQAVIPGSGEVVEDITIADDDTLTGNITLTADPANVDEDAGLTEVEITATVDGQVFDDDLKLTLVLAAGGATRDVDYTATLRSLTIEAGQVSGSKTIDIIPIDDGIVDADEKITVTTVEQDLKNDDEDVITIKPAEITLKDTGVKAAPEDPDDTTPAFSEEDALASATAIEGVAGEALEDVVLPEAEGDGDLTYSVSANLPAGLSFDPATRTLSGTPASAGDTGIVYTALDGDEGEHLPAEAAVLTYNIEIAEQPEPVATVKSVSLTQTSIRENGEATSISVTATLSEPAPEAETISFTIGNASGTNKAAVRDVDFTVSVIGRVAIEAGDTQATSTMVLTPINNNDTDGNRSFGVHAAASGGSASADFTIADDETASTGISLSADPHTVSEDGGVLVIEITATLNGKVLDADATVTLSIDPNSQATRDVDYVAIFNPLLTIPTGEVSGSVEMAFEPTSDAVDEGNETITLLGEIEGLTDGTGQIVLADAAMMDDDMMMDPLAFAEGAMIDDIGVTAGSPLSATELPAASGGDGDITYSVDGLPEGLLFDADSRTLSGSTDVEGAAEVTYTATAGEESVSLTFTITVNPPLSFGELFGLLLEGAVGKANPADSHVDEDGVLQIVVGQPYSLTLPAVEGGTPPYTYELTGLPAGLSFDPATRTVSGTPTELSDTFAITYRVTDGSGASRSLPILAAVVNPPLDAPDALVAEDYKGADGAGDQGGFVLLTWDLSEHHGGIDGYRIFRELPVLGNEMVPWAMVDAVPGVSIGRAIVATLDNVATNWGIAAERGGQTTHGAAKAVSIDAENAYALMAETMMDSREAAQAGDGPVFASLLPEALAYAQGVAPNLNVIAGVLSSAVTVTEEPARAIDNIAPLAVPSFSVLDAPNDQGSRILLTWTLSPSDQVLQDVVAGVVGPAQLEPVVGVHGYSIYRRAAGEDEFARIGQVDAGVTSFVDETALNGVRYTYQVRPYDLDNETGSDLEQTAMAVRNLAVDSEGRTLFGLFGADNSIGFDDFFIFADNFGLTAEDTGFDPAFDLAPNAMIDFDDFFVFADNFGRSTAAAGKIVPMLAGLNADARMYLDARTAMPVVGEDFVLDVRLADFAAIKGYGLQVQYDASQLEFVEVLTDQPLGGGEFATPQVLSNVAGVLAVAALGDVVSEGEVALSLVFRAPTEIENTLIEITDNQTYDSEFGFNRLALPAPVQLQTRPEVFALANNYPNPFNPATTIKYALPQAADVELTVYNVVGQPVRTLVAEHQNAGRYVVEWDATNDNGHRLASGMYFYRLEAGGEFLEIKKMLLLK